MRHCCCGDELGLGPVILDEPAAGGATAAYRAGHEQAGPGNFLGNGRVGLDAEAAEDGFVRMVAGEGVHEVGGDGKRERREPRPQRIRNGELLNCRPDPKLYSM